MKFVHEVQDKIDTYGKPSYRSYESLIVQALEWALKIMLKDPPDLAEAVIRRRIEKLEENQKGFMAFTTDTPRAMQINALKWVVDEYEFDTGDE